MILMKSAQQNKDTRKIAAEFQVESNIESNKILYLIEIYEDNKIIPLR